MAMCSGDAGGREDEEGAGAVLRGGVLHLLLLPVPVITGYWAFGNKSLMPDEGPFLAPTWLLGLAVVLVLLTSYSPSRSSTRRWHTRLWRRALPIDAARRRLLQRNVVPRVALWTACAFVAAMLPFFGDIMGVGGRETEREKEDWGSL
uniref:Uncharacterized protein n=1 Tax=Oryza glumipatula TaxID=40148 RepID=A0A0E0AR83_9ORYZ